jgi:hypothetical protein
MAEEGRMHDLEPKPDTLRRKATHDAATELTDEELNEICGGDGPPGTAGDGNGRVRTCS